MPPVKPNTTDTASHGDAFDRALQALARAGIGFEIVSEASPWERAA